MLNSIASDLDTVGIRIREVKRIGKSGALVCLLDTWTFENINERKRKLDHPDKCKHFIQSINTNTFILYFKHTIFKEL